MATKDDDREEKLLKDGQVLRIRMFAMDSQKAYSHRPGYRVGQKLLTDSETRETLADVYEQYENDLTTRWQRTSPEPVINTPAAPVLDADFDINDDADLRELAYRLYDSDIASRWKGK